MFKVFTTKEFDEDFNKLDGSDKKIVEKIMNQLKEQGGEVGKPLQRSYFREKKFGNKRLYFLIYKEFMVVLGVAIGDKKLQQTTIDKTISRIKYYEKLVVEKLREFD